MQKRVLITAGGTGGHVFPALALADELTHQSVKIHFAAGKLSKNPYFGNSSYQFQDVSCGQIRKNPIQFLKESYQVLQGVKESIQIINEFNPDVVVGFGSYFTLPVLIAAKLTRKPIFLHEANSIPGLVNRLFSPYVEKTFVHFQETRDLLKGESCFSGMPLRSSFKKGLVSKEDARAAFQLSPHIPTLLVFGGSQGAKKINELFSEATLYHLKDLLPTFQVIHFTGNHEETEQLMGRYVSANVPAYVRPFEKKMSLAWAAADFAITRAGAASIAEQIEYEIPGILIPYPFSSDFHQEKNADLLVKTGLGRKVSEEGLTPQSLSSVIQETYLQLDNKLSTFQEYKKQNPQVSLSEQIMQWMQKNNE